MNPTSLCLMGASCRAAAQAAQRAGVEDLHAWDDFIDADLSEIAHASPLALLDCNELPSGVFDRMPLVLCGGMENKPGLVHSLIELGAICGVTAESIQDLRSIDRWQSWALRAEVGWPETLPANELFHPANFSDYRTTTHRWLVKPRWGAGGIHVRSLDSLQGGIPVIQPDDYLQRYIDGISIGVTYCSDRNQTRLVGIAQAIPSELLEAPLEFIYTGNIAPYRLSKEAYRKVQRFGQLVPQETYLQGLWQADFQLDSDGQVWLLEINPRWSASMELHETLQEVSWMQEHLRILQHGMQVPRMPSGSDPQDQLINDRMLAKGILYAPTTIRVNAEQVDRLWQVRWRGSYRELLSSTFRLADIPRLSASDDPTQGLELASGTPIATILCSGVSQEDLIGKLRHARKILLDWLQTK